MSRYFALLVFVLCLVCPVLSVFFACPFLDNSFCFSNLYLYYKTILMRISLCGPDWTVVNHGFAIRGRRGHDHMVVGFTTTCAIRAYHH
jgi:hypothetical protein